MLFQVSGQKQLELPMLVFFKLHEYHIIVPEEHFKGEYLTLEVEC